MIKNDNNVIKHAFKERIHPSVKLKKKLKNKQWKKKKALRGLLPLQNSIEIKDSVEPRVREPLPKGLHNALQGGCYFSYELPIPIFSQKLFPRVGLLVMKGIEPSNTWIVCRKPHSFDYCFCRDMNSVLSKSLNDNMRRNISSIESYS